MRTVVTVDVLRYPYDGPKYWAVSIDEPLDENFIETQPEKIWIYGPIWLEKILDLSPGTHTITVGVDTPPEKPWLVQVWINDQSITDRMYIPVSHGNFLQTTFDVTSDAPYVPVSIPRGDEVYNPITRECQVLKYKENPALIDWKPCWEDQPQYDPVLRYTFHHYVFFQSPEPPEQFLPRLWFLLIPLVGTEVGARSRVWWRMVKDEGTSTIEYWNPLPLSPRVQDWKGSYCFGPYRGVLPPWYVLNPIPIDETVTIIAGHIENDTAPRSQWKYIEDCSVTFPFRLNESCEKAPISYPKISITNYAVYPTVPIDNFRPGRWNLVITELQNIGTAGIAWPFIKVKEDFNPDCPIYERNFNYYPPPDSEIKSPTIAVGQKTTLFLIVELTETMVKQGYFTLQAGHFEGLQKARLIAPMTPIVDQEIRIPLLQPTDMASIRRLTLSHTLPPIYAKIQSLTLSHTPPPIAAKIRSLKLSHIAPPPPPPPPPPGKASLGGKVLSLLGPVADAEVTLNGFTTKTGRDGSFHLTDIPYGTYTLTVKPTKIHEKLLLKPLSQKLDVYRDMSKIITLPLNYTNLAIGAGATAAIGTILATAKKPKAPPTW